MLVKSVAPSSAAFASCASVFETRSAGGVSPPANTRSSWREITSAFSALFAVVDAGGTALSFLHAPAASTTAASAARENEDEILTRILPLEREDPHDATLASVPREIAREIRGLANIRGIIGLVVTRQKQPIAPDAGVDRDVLFAIGAREGDRIADDARAHLEAPEHGAGGCIRRLEPPIERAVEHDVAARRETAAPYRKLLLDLPCALSRRRVPCDEGTHIRIAAGMVRAVDSHERRAREMRGLHGRVVHAHAVRGGIEQLRHRRVRDRGRGALPTLECRTDVLHVSLRRAGSLRVIEHGTPRREVDLRRPVYMHVRLGEKHLAGRAIHRVCEPVLVEMHER